jgi:hypothetical protein
MAFYPRKLNDIETLRLEKERLKLEIKNKNLSNLLTLNDVKDAISSSFNSKRSSTTKLGLGNIALGLVSGLGMKEMLLKWVLTKFKRNKDSKSSSASIANENTTDKQKQKSTIAQKLLTALMNGIDSLMDAQKKG